MVIFPRKLENDEVYSLHRQNTIYSDRQTDREIQKPREKRRLKLGLKLVGPRFIQID